MGTKSMKALRDELRAGAVEQLRAWLVERGEDVQQTASNTLAIPCVDEGGNDQWLVFTVKVPTGERGDDGEPYDGYGEAEVYAAKVAEKAEKAKEAAAKKAAKIAKDQATREARAKAKAEHQKAEG